MQENLERIEQKLDQLIEDQSRNSTDIIWIKSIGGAIMTTLAYLFSKTHGGT